MSRTMTLRARGQGGFSIVEMMVAVVIGMLALLFVTQMITSSQKTNQAAVSGSDAMQNGMLAMFSMSNDAAEAGFGLNDPLLAGCDTNFTDAVNGFTLAPAAINGTATTPLAAVVIQNNVNAPDVITMYSGSSPTGTASVRLVVNYTGGTTLSIDRAPTGFGRGDVIVVAPELPGTKCSLAQVSVTPDLGATTKILSIDKAADLPFNSGALGASYTGSKARAFDLGPAATLSFHTWSVVGGFLNLRSTTVKGGAALSVPVADNIVSIKAMYGFDNRSGTAFTPELGTTVGLWSASMIDADSDGITGGPGDYQRIVALRLAVVARSKSPERPAAGTTACTATPDASTPVVFNAYQPGTTTSMAIKPTVTVAGDSQDWHCYRYRVYETIVPIRNAAWRPTAWTK